MQLFLRGEQTHTIEVTGEESVADLKVRPSKKYICLASPPASFFEAACFFYFFIIIIIFFFLAIATHQMMSDLNR